MLAIINEWPTNMMGGSNYHTLKVISHWTKDYEIDVLLPRLGYTYAQGELVGNAIITDSLFERDMSGLLGKILSIFSRILAGLLISPAGHNDVIVASSHYLADVIPAVYLKVKNPDSALVTYHHASLISERSIAMALLRKVNDAISVPLLRRYADLIFAINQPIKDFLVANRVAEEKIQITNNGTEEFTSDENSMIPIFDACFVGRLEKGKGVFDLVEAWKGVCVELPTAKLAIIGEGSKKQDLIELIARERLQDSIIIHGYLGEERFEIMRQSKVFLLPSYLEAWPIVIIEAMSCGLPVIIYDLPELRALWGDYLTYVPKGDTESLKQSVLNLLRDSKLRAKFSQSGQKRSKQYLWSSVATQEARAIESLLTLQTGRN